MEFKGQDHSIFEPRLSLKVKVMGVVGSATYSSIPVTNSNSERKIEDDHTIITILER